MAAAAPQREPSSQLLLCLSFGSSPIGQVAAEFVEDAQVQVVVVEVEPADVLRFGGVEGDARAEGVPTSREALRAACLAGDDAFVAQHGAGLLDDGPDLPVDADREVLRRIHQLGDEHRRAPHVE